MATKPYSAKYTSSNAMVVTWSDLDASDDGTPIYVAAFNEFTVQHTAGAGTVAMEGSNDAGVTWSALSDEQGDAIATLAVDAFAVIGERPALIRPVVTTGTNDVVVLVCGR